MPKKNEHTWVKLAVHLNSEEAEVNSNVMHTRHGDIHSRTGVANSVKSDNHRSYAIGIRRR